MSVSYRQFLLQLNFHLCQDLRYFLSILLFGSPVSVPLLMLLGLMGEKQAMSLRGARWAATCQRGQGV